MVFACERLSRQNVVNDAVGDGCIIESSALEEAHMRSVVGSGSEVVAATVKLAIVSASVLHPEHFQCWQLAHASSTATESGPKLQLQQ